MQQLWDSSVKLAPMIEVKKLTKSFGTLYALRGIDLQISRGTFLTIFGPNGAGKTTFLRILATLSRASSGRILIDGKPLKHQAEAVRRRLGVIAHATFLYDELTAVENLRFYGKMFDLKDIAGRSEQVLEDVGLGSRKNDLVRTFSRGMQQRLSIARAMLHDPDILLLDEPYTGLDQHAAKMLTDWLARLRSENRTIIMVTHELDSGITLAERAAIFLRGKLAYHEAVNSSSREAFRNIYFDIVASGRQD